MQRPKNAPAKPSARRKQGASRLWPKATKRSQNGYKVGCVLLPYPEPFRLTLAFTARRLAALQVVARLLQGCCRKVQLPTHAMRACITPRSGQRRAWPCLLASRPDWQALNGLAVLRGARAPLCLPFGFALFWVCCPWPWQRIPFHSFPCLSITDAYGQFPGVWPPVAFDPLNASLARAWV
jgi:hypothetical protein